MKNNKLSNTDKFVFLKFNFFTFLNNFFSGGNKKKPRACLNAYYLIELCSNRTRVGKTHEIKHLI